MNKSLEITVNGVSYPCRMTMGAMLRFKRETGREITDVQMTSLSDVAILLWCCTASACNADKIDFKLSLEDFCDGISEEEMFSATNAFETDGGSSDQQKKSS